MSRTHPKRLATDLHAARRNTRRRLATAAQRGGKTAKADRKHNRDSLRETRKEYGR